MGTDPAAGYLQDPPHPEFSNCPVAPVGRLLPKDIQTDQIVEMVKKYRMKIARK